MGRAAIHKQNLVRTAMRLFRRQGYASTGLQQIVAESGAPKGSLYHYFPSGKEALGEAAIELAGGMIREMLAGLAARHREPSAFLRAYCEGDGGLDAGVGLPLGLPGRDHAARDRAAVAPRSPRPDGAPSTVGSRWWAACSRTRESRGARRGAGPSW